VPRPAIRPGEWGQISFKKDQTRKIWVARARYCDTAGIVRDWSASARRKTDAKQALLDKFAQGYAIGVGPDTGINGNSTIDELWSFWWDETRLINTYSTGYAASTLTGYERVFRLHISPALGGLRIGDIPVSRLDLHIKHLMGASLHNARLARIVLKMMFALAVRHDARDDNRNPVDHVLSVPTREPAIGVIEFDRIAALRDVISKEDARLKPGPKTMNPWSDVVDLLFLGLRIGEALALRWEDVDFEYPKDNGLRTAITVCGTLDSQTGVGVYRKPVTKTANGMRIVIVPDYVASMLWRRRVDSPAKNLHGSVFVSARGNWVSPNNVRRAWRKIRDDAGFPDVTPHTFRRTTATFIDREVGSVAASRLLGHANDSVTKRHYIQRPVEAPDLSALLQRFEK
jgi:integrase